MASSLVQINTRVPAELKKAGDLALARAGYTPQQAVRLVWEFAAAHTHEPQAIRRAFEEQDAKQEDDPGKQERLRRFEEGAGILGKMYEQLGIDPQKCALEHLDYKELRDLYYEEKLAEE